MGNCGQKQRCTSPAERNNVGMGTVENDALFILFIISIAQVGEVLWGQIIVSARKMWAQSLKRATL